MSIQVYVVMGSTGEYSDRSEWAVCAYQDKSKAEQHADHAKLIAHKIFRNGDERYEDLDNKNAYDPYMRMQYTGTDYYVLSVDLLDAIPGIDG